MRVAALLSTAGSVLRAAMAGSRGLAEDLTLVVADRPCGGIEFARAIGVEAAVLTGRPFSDDLADLLAERGIEAAYVFYDRLLRGRLLDTYRNRLVNFHPSLLPFGAGLHGFEDGVSSRARVIGSTVHFIDEGLDTGPRIQQARVVVEPDIPVELLRHRVYIDQVCSLIQVHQWLREDRITVRERTVVVRGAPADDGAFDPGLDSAEALAYRAQALA